MLLAIGRQLAGRYHGKRVDNQRFHAEKNQDSKKHVFVYDMDILLLVCGLVACLGVALLALCGACRVYVLEIRDPVKVAACERWWRRTSTVWRTDDADCEADTRFCGWRSWKTCTCCRVRYCVPVGLQFHWANKVTQYVYFAPDRGAWVSWFRIESFSKSHLEGIRSCMDENEIGLLLR